MKKIGTLTVCILLLLLFAVTFLLIVVIHGNDADEDDADDKANRQAATAIEYFLSYIIWYLHSGHFIVCFPFVSYNSG